MEAYYERYYWDRSRVHIEDMLENEWIALLNYLELLRKLNIIASVTSFNSSRNLSIFVELKNLNT